MSLYKDYLTERTNDKIIESDAGFVTYRYINEGKSVYIIDIYIVPDARKKGSGSYLAQLVEEEALDMGCTEMIGTVCPSAKHSTTSLKVLLAYGFTLHSATENMIIFKRDL